MDIKNRKESHKLLSSLQSLYKKLAVAMLELRKSTYRYVTATGKESKVKTIINTKIDELVSIHEKAQAETTSNSNHVSKYENDHIKAGQNIEKESNRAGKALENELSKYLKTETLSSVTHPGIVTKLTESTWEHIHAALRMARQGDADKARLHLDIADQALNEVSHYMSSDDFSILVNNVEQYLHELQE